MGDISIDFENNIKIERKEIRGCRLDSSVTEDGGPVTGSCETCNESRGFVTHGKPHEYLSDYQLVTEDSPLCCSLEFKCVCDLYLILTS